MKLLRRELCRLMLGNMGLVPPPNFGRVGLSTNDFKIDKVISLEFEDERGNKYTEGFGVWCGSITLQGMRIRAIATDICDNESNYHEFIVVYALDGAPIHGIKVIYGEEHNGLFVVKGDIFSGEGIVENDVWKPVGRYEMLVAAAGFEKMNDVGVTWVPCNEYDDLYESLIEVVSMG